MLNRSLINHKHNSLNKIYKSFTIISFPVNFQIGLIFELHHFRNKKFTISGILSPCFLDFIEPFKLFKSWHSSLQSFIFVFSDITSVCFDMFRRLYFREDYSIIDIFLSSIVNYHWPFFIVLNNYIVFYDLFLLFKTRRICLQWTLNLFLMKGNSQKLILELDPERFRRILTLFIFFLRLRFFWKWMMMFQKPHW